jgi:hypothetical protein
MTQSMRFEWRRRVVRDAALTDATRRVLLELESYANPDGTNARPGRDRIAQELLSNESESGHMSTKTVGKALAHGIELGYIAMTEPAPRGRGNRRAAVYRLLFPCQVLEEPQASPNNDREIGELQASPNRPEIGELTTLNRGTQSPKRGNPEVPTTSSLPPDEFSPERVSHVSNAGARDETPPPNRDDNDALEWIATRLYPDGYKSAERIRAEELLADGLDRNEVKTALLRERQRHCRRHRGWDPGDIGPCGACKEARLAFEASEDRQAALPVPDIRDCPDCDGNIWLDENATRKCTHPNLPGWRSA